MLSCLSRIRVAILIPLIAVCSSVLDVRAADTIPSERRLGNDVIAYFTINNVSELKANWGKTQLGQLLQDKELATFLKQFEEPWAKGAEKFESEVGLSLNDVLTVPQGQFSLAVVHSAGKQMGVVAFLDFGDKRETVDKLIEKGVKALEESGKAKRKEEDVEGTAVTVYEFEMGEEAAEEDEDKPKKKTANTNALTYCIKDSILVVGSRLDIIKSVLTRWDGQNERIFADKQAYKYIKEKCRGENAEAANQMTWYLDPIGLFKGGLALGNLGPTETAVALGFLPSLGLDKVKGVGGTLDMGTDEFDMVSRSLFYVDQPPTGVLNALQFPKKNQAPPKWVSADVSTYAAFSWDLAEVYNTVETLYDTFLGAGSFSQQVDKLAEEGPKIHIKKDIVDHLAGNIIVVGHVPEQADLTAGERYLICVELKDEAPLKGVIEKLADEESASLKVREFEGNKIFEFSVTDSEDTENPFHPAVGIANKYLVFATHVAELEGMLRSNKDHESLVDSEAYKTIAKRFPDQTSSLGFQRSDAQLKLIYDAMKSGALTEIFDEGDFQLDTQSLPEFDTLKKYFKPSGGYMIPDEKGWFMISFSLKADAKE